MLNTLAKFVNKAYKHILQNKMTMSINMVKVQL